MNGKKKIAIIAIIIVVFAASISIGIFATGKARDKKIQENLDLGNKYLNELDYGSALATYTTVLEIDPKNVEAYLGMVEAYLGKEDYESAQDCAQTGYDITGNEQLKEKIEEIKKMIAIIEKLEQGEQYLAEEKYADALEIFKEVLVIVSNNIRAIAGVTNAYWGLVNDYIEAAEFLNALTFAKVAYEETGDERFQEIITNIENGTMKCQVLGHVWRKENYQQAKSCEVCKTVEGEPLQSEFEKRGLKCDVKVGETYDYTSALGEAGSGPGPETVVITEYETFVSDDTHDAKDGYIWKSMKLQYVFNLGAEESAVISHNLYDYYMYDVSDRTLVTSNNQGDNKQFAFNVNWNGTDYQCKWHDICTSEILETETGFVLVVDVVCDIQIPKGYDGVVFKICAYRDDLCEHLFFRMD